MLSFLSDQYRGIEGTTKAVPSDTAGKLAVGSQKRDKLLPPQE
jgi:hypothetical protein